MLGPGKNTKKSQKRFAVFAPGYSDAYATLYLFLSLMGLYRSTLLNMGSTDFIRIAEPNLHLLLPSDMGSVKCCFAELQKSMLCRYITSPCELTLIRFPFLTSENGRMLQKLPKLPYTARKKLFLQHLTVFRAEKWYLIRVISPVKLNPCLSGAFWESITTAELP